MGSMWHETLNNMMACQLKNVKLIQAISNTHRESKKTRIKLSSITYPNINRFSKFFRGRVSGKFAPNTYLNIPSHLKYFATLTCEIWMSENWQQPEICIVINDKWHGSKAKNISCERLLHYKYITQLAGERIFKIGEHLAVTGKMVDCVIHPISLRHLSSQDTELAR